MMGSAVLEAIVKLKEKYLGLDILAKRALYACKENYVTIDQIPDWNEYVKQKNLASPIPEEKDEKIFSEDCEINSKVSLWQGDITRLEIDAVVNAANNRMLGGGGVDGRIHDAAGEELLQECETVGGCETGSAKITGGYKLPAKYIIHTVGPQTQDWKLLKSAYANSLQLMKENSLKTIAFPCISTGIYGYPVEDASHVALKTVRDFLHDSKNEVERIIFTVYSDDDKAVYERNMFAYFPIPKNKQGDNKPALEQQQEQQPIKEQDK